MGRLKSKEKKQNKKEHSLKKKSTKKSTKKYNGTRSSKTSLKKKSNAASNNKKRAISKKASKKTSVKPVPKRRGRPPKKNKDDRVENVHKLELDILSVTEISEETEDSDTPKKRSARDMLEQIMFRLPYVLDPLIGTPKQVQEELDKLAKKMQRRPNDNKSFNKIHLYMHGYLVHVVLKKFPFIKGFQSVDIYQETLIALKFKAIPNFKDDKGMSFLNFAKMCIRRHLITLLNASKNRKRDRSMNQAISLDSSPIGSEDEEGRNSYMNIIKDNSAGVDEEIEVNEAYSVTKDALLGILSDFERIVLREYLESSSYKEISKNISKNLKGRYNTKSIDNALLRIRKKAIHLKCNCKLEDLPIFIPN